MSDVGLGRKPSLSAPGPASGVVGFLIDQAIAKQEKCRRLAVRYARLADLHGRVRAVLEDVAESERVTDTGR